MKSAWILCLTLCATGCSTFTANQTNDELSYNRSDHEYCTDHGLNYPESAYIQCRWNLANARLYRQWKSAQMLNRAAQPANSPSASPIGQQYRPLDPGHFHCRPAKRLGNDYVLCDYDEAGVGGSGR